MIRSMTGFGKASAEFNGKKLSAEVKTLNSKMNDTKLRIPNTYREHELTVRKAIADKLVRGKIDALITIESAGTETTSNINQELAASYFNQIKSLSDRLGEDGNFLEMVVKMPGVIEAEKFEADEQEWNAVLQVIDQSLEAVNQFRLDEGSKLEADLVKRLENISTHLEAIIELAPERTEAKKEKLQSKFKEMMDEVDNLDANRFEQELIYYLEKLDITEEKVRLRAHLEYFQNTMKTDPVPGKKLGFIAQEMGREINTIGSKANHAEMQKHVVHMKDELEKIKEQVLNIL